MSSTIDTELATLHARIAQLEEAKKIPPPPAITAHECLDKAKENVKRNQSSKNKSPISIACRYSYASMTEMLESVVESLNRIHARLDAVEKH
jgi:hypothetical protein